MTGTGDGSGGTSSGVSTLLFHSAHALDGTYLYASDAAEELLGLEPAAVVGRDAYEFFHPEDVGVVGASHARVLGLSDATAVTYRIRHVDGSYAWVTTTCIQRIDERSGEAVAIDCVTTRAAPDVSEEAVSSAQARFARVVERTTDLVLVLDAETAQVVYANPLLEQLVGVEPAMLAGASFFELVAPDHLTNVVGVLGDLLHHPGAASPFTMAFSRVDAAPLNVSAVAVNLIDDEVVGGVLLVAHDIAEPRATMLDLAPDVLPARTRGALSHTELSPRLQAMIEAEPDGGVVLVAVRLDDLDTVGMALGSDAARRVFQQATERLVELCGEPAQVAHLGEAKLAVISPLPTRAWARALGERIHDRLSPAFLVDGAELFVAPRVVVGLAAPQATAEGLVISALSHLERTEPGTRTVLAEIGARDEALARLALQRDLRFAIERDEFVLHYQPVIALDSGQIIGAEALIRWDHPSRGLLHPHEFVPVAEHSSFIGPLGRWVLHEACRQLDEWAVAHRDPPLVIGVNVSPNQLHDDRFVESVSDALTIHAVAPHQISLEITETAIMETDEATRGVLDRLREIGLTIAIDDFGTGYASLDYLRRIPANTVKIDKAFIDGLGSNPEDDAIVGGVIAIAHALGRVVVAEGVETTRQIERLQELGCDYAQGYLIAKPMTSAEFASLLHRHHQAPVQHHTTPPSRGSPRRS